jgi:hypothetical protein
MNTTLTESHMQKRENKICGKLFQEPESIGNKPYIFR